MPKFLIFAALLAVLFGCSENPNDLDIPEDSNEPVLELENVQTLFSDSAIVKLKVTGDRQLEYQNGDQEFPEGIYIETYEDSTGTLASSIKADKGYYSKKDDLYTAEGNVIVKNHKENQTLKTELLYWAPREDKIYTDKFVEIETDGDILMGTGLTSNQEFSDWEILNPGGSSFTIEDNQ